MTDKSSPRPWFYKGVLRELDPDEAATAAWLRFTLSNREDLSLVPDASWEVYNQAALRAIMADKLCSEDLRTVCTAAYLLAASNPVHDKAAT